MHKFIYLSIFITIFYVYIYKLKYRIYCCYTFIEPHQWSYYSLIFYLFFSLFKLLFSILKKKNLFFSLLVHSYSYTSSNFPFPLYLFISSLLLTFLLHFFHHFFSYILTLLLLIFFFFVLNSISSLPFNPYFLPKIFEFSLSLSLSQIFVLSYNFD